MRKENKGENTLNLNCNFKTWIDTEYKFTCNLIHSSPAATFKKLSNPENANIIPVGRSSNAIGLPAQNSAYFLLISTVSFLQEYKYHTGCIYSLTLMKLFDKLKEVYNGIENRIDNDY